MAKTKAAAVLILVSLIVASFGSNPVWAGEGESGSTILSEADRSFLSVTCDLAEVITVYQKYAAKISAAQKETQPTPTETTPQITPGTATPKPTPDIAQVQVSEDETAAQLNQLKKEIQAIVEKCFTKELENLKCPTKACDASTFLPQARRINRDYFLYTQLPVRLSEQHLDQLFKKVKECLEKLFKDCGCDVECLKCLLNAIYSDSDYVRLANSYGYSNVADFMLERSGRLGTAIDFPMSMGEDDELVERILGKLKECGYQPKPKPETIETETPTEVKAETPDKGIQIPTPEGTKHLPETEELAKDKEADIQKEAEAAFKKLDKLLKEAKQKEPKKPIEAPRERLGETEAEGILNKVEEIYKELAKLAELYDEAKKMREEAGEEGESASKLPRITVMLPDEDLMENEDIWQGLTAFGVIDFYTSAPSIDVSMFNFITENTEAEVEITAPITDETSEIAREITIEVIDSELILKDKWAEAKTTLPLVIKESKLYAGQDDILYPISLLPGEIKAGLEVPLLKVDLEYDENQAPVYKVHSEEKTKLIFVPVELTREITIDPASGEVRNVKQPWWGALVSKSIIPVKVVPLPAPPQPVTPIVNPCPCPKLTEYKIRWDYMCLDYTKLTRNTIRVFVIPPAGDVRESCSYQWQIDWGDGNRDAAGIRFPPYAGNYDDPYYTVYAHGYKGIGNYQVTVKLFNKCDERTKTFKIPIGRPECNELVDKSLKDVNFDKQQFVDKADQLDESSLFDFINHQVNPLCSNLPGKTVTAMHYGTEGKICHVLVSITTKGIDPLKMKTRPEEHISELIRFHTLPSIFKASNRIYKKTDKDGRQAAYYEQGKNSAKIVYTPGEEPFFSLVMVFRSDCNCREEDMRYRIISNLTQVAEKKATKEAKENLKSDSTAPVKHYSKRVVDVLLEIGVCCPPGECK